MVEIPAILSQIVTYMPIYALAGLGIAVGGRAGIFNISGEGIMMASASAGFLGAYLTGNWFIGFLAGALLGGLFGLVLVALHESFKISQFIIGIALVIVGTGLSDLLYKLVVGVQLFAPEAPDVPAVAIPWLNRVPALAAVFNQNVVVYFTLLVVVLAYHVFYRTRVGLETRAIGEDPKAADVVGINVLARRYATGALGGTLMGIAGTYLPMIITGTYTTNIVNGRGFMAIGIAIFASWRPERTLLGALIFAGVEVLAFQQQLGGTRIPYQFLLMLPFVAVLVVMWLFRRHVEFPASLGKAYSRE